MLPTVRVAVIDSGVHASHPHIHSVAGGISFVGPAEDTVDRLGHGTAVMAAIQEKAPEAAYYAVRVFDRRLQTSIDVLLNALAWCIDEKMNVVNLSLGTRTQAHRERFLPLIAKAQESGLILVSACENGGDPWLPGSLPGVLGVGLDATCPRDEYREENGHFLASGYPRPLPGLPVERNLSGISFAVANFTGFVVRACTGLTSRSAAHARQALLMPGRPESQ